MVLRISQLKSYNALRTFLFRKLKGGEMHRDKLINRLYSFFVNDFGVRNDLPMTIRADQFFKGTGFRAWINRLHLAGIVDRVKGRRCSMYRLGAVGLKYLRKIYSEMQAGLVQDKENVYKGHVNKRKYDAKEAEVEFLKKQLANLRAEFDESKQDIKNLQAVLTPKQQEENPELMEERHLTVVK